MIKVNLGCGRKPLPGYINIDKFRWPGVDVICDIDKEPLPGFLDGAIDEVRADHALEHFADLHRAMKEIHRVLRVGGLLRLRVPYGLSSLYDPYHRFVFDETTLDYFADRKRIHDTCLQIEQPTGWFHIDYFHINRGFRIGHGIPFRWHLSKYIPNASRWFNGDSRDMDWHIGWKREIVAIMRRLP